jgi:predicted DNA repair protein MutK
MARFVTGKTFGTTETVTAALLNQAVNDAAISTDSVDGSTIEVNSNALRIKDNGITTAKIADNAVTTAKIADNAVTLAKMATQADQTVLGNVSGGTAVPTAVPIVGAAGILVNNDSLGKDDTKGATQGNIKAFVENLIGTADKSGSGVVTEGTQGSITLGGGLIVKFGSVDVNSSSVTLTFKDSSGSNTPFPNAIYGVMVTAQEDSGSGAESAGVSDLALGSCTVKGYNSSSGGAVGRVFFIAIGH